MGGRTRRGVCGAPELADGSFPVEERMRGVIRKVFAEHLPAVLAERELGEREWRGAWCVSTCRTAAQGTHVRVCGCGHSEGEAFNSCRHRGCPQCGGPATRRWVEARAAQVLGCSHVHTIWTVPDVFGALWAFNRTVFTNLMFRACWETVRVLMGDPRWCGGVPGMLAVFQSWGDLLQRHPHIHALVTAGGVDGDGAWREPTQSFVICARAAMALFRGKMRAFVLEGLDTGALVCPPGTTAADWVREANRQGLRKWNVRVEPPYAETGRVIRYVGAYLKRGPLSERRVVSYDGETVSIAHRHPDEHVAPTFELSGPECVRRLLLHMPEPRLHTSRAYGLYHPAATARLAAARTSVGPPREPVPRAETSSPGAVRSSRPLCPVCGRPMRVRVLTRGGQSPPQRFRTEQRSRAA